MVINRQFRADDLLMCQDYATIGTRRLTCGLSLQMRRVRVPLVPLVLLQFTIRLQYRLWLK